MKPEKLTAVIQALMAFPEDTVGVASVHGPYYYCRYCHENCSKVYEDDVMRMPGVLASENPRVEVTGHTDDCPVALREKALAMS